MRRGVYIKKNVLAIALANKLARIAWQYFTAAHDTSQQSPRKSDLKGFLPRFARRNDNNGNKVTRRNCNLVI